MDKCVSSATIRSDYILRTCVVRIFLSVCLIIIKFRLVTANFPPRREKMFERLASLGIMGDQLKAPLAPVNAIVFCDIQGVSRGVPDWAHVIGNV